METWRLDEGAHAGPEHLDPGYVAGYERKAGYDPTPDVEVLLAHGVGPDGVVVDLAAGTGVFARAMAPHCGHVVAVDVSPAMVATLRARVADEGLGNVTVVGGGFLSYEHAGPPPAAVFTRNALHQLPDFWKVVALRRIAGLLGPSRRNAMIAIGIVFTPAIARVVRGTVLEVMGFPYIESTRALGASGRRVMTRHLLPNIVAPLIVLVTVYLGSAILAEAALSFLGLGTQPPEASWGGMLNTARSYIDAAWWLSVFPGAAIMLVVLGFNFLGDGLRDILDPRLGPSVGGGL
jgi:SAM-dependent methyltransferase